MPSFSQPFVATCVSTWQRLWSGQECTKLRRPRPWYESIALLATGPNWKSSIFDHSFIAVAHAVRAAVSFASSGAAA